MEQFDQLLTCAICLDRYRNPKLLPCQHSFCMEPCMEGLVDYVKRQVKCPECRAEHRIPYQGVQAFPTNVTLQRFLELHIDLTGELPDPTSNQVMERCQVCSEKSYLIVCAHCDKKICTDCKDAHMDVLKREISRISHQVRRVLHRLEDALTLADKNSLLLQQNSLSVMEEIDDIYRRLAKALKDRSEYMKHEVERYLQTELKTLNVFKYNMEQEVGNITSNCELVEKYISPDAAPSTTWDDSELMDTKDIFLKTMEFIRAFDYEPGDYARRVRFLMGSDPNSLQVTLATYGDLHLPPSNPTGQVGSNSQPYHHHGPSQSQFGSGLMRSKSDHRLTTQFRNNDYEDSGPSGGGRSSPVFGRKFGERKEKGGGGGDFEQFEIPPPQTERKRFRSRFARHLPDNTFDETADSRGVRFESGNESARRERERVLDTEDIARGPISGLVRLLDSPRVIQRVQETELGPRPSKVVAPPPAPAAIAPVVAAVEVKAPWRAPSRQLSEDDEIAKQKRANKETAASSTKVTQPVVADARAPVTTRRQTSTEPRPMTNERTSSRTPSESGEVHDRDDTSHGGAAISGATTDRLPRKLSPERFPTKNRSESSDSGSSESSTASSNASRNTGAAFTMDEIRQRFLSKTSSSADKSSSSLPSPPINSSGGTIVSTGRDGGSGGTTAGPTSRPTSTPTNSSSKPTFSTRYLGRTNTPTAEAKEEEESSSEEEEEETESDESEEEDKGKVASSSATEKSGGGSSLAAARMEKTDIGPLLARSANERGNTSTNYTNSKKESPPLTVASYRRTRDAATRLTSPPDREIPTSRYTAPTTPTTPTNPSSNTNYGRYNSRTNTGSSDYGTGSTGSALARSRSTVYNTSTDDSPTSTTPSRYSGLASKYLNRSRHTFDDDTPLTTSTTTTSPSSRYEVPSSSKSSRDKKPSKVSKSKSTHDVLRAASLDFNAQVEPDDILLSSGSGRQSAGRRRRKMSAAPSTDVGQTDESLSSWARYLKNKYGKGDKRIERGMSLDESASSASHSGSVVVGISDRPKRLSFSTPGHPYANKNRIQYKFGSRGSEAGKLTWPRGICCAEDSDGSVRVVVADSTNHRICVFDESGNFIKEFGSYGSGDGEFDCPGAVWVNRIGQFIVSDRYNHRIQVFDPSGRFLRAFGSQGEAPGKFSYPLGVTADALNFIYVCEESRIQVFQSDGTFVGKFGCPGTKIGELSHPHYIAVTSTNKVVVSDTNNSRIQIFDVNGKVLSCFGSEGSDEGLLKSPRGVAVDESGYIVVGDSGNNRIQIFSPDGVFVKAIGSWGGGDQEFKGLEGLATANGNIFAVDRVNHSVTVI